MSPADKMLAKYKRRNDRRPIRYSSSRPNIQKPYMLKARWVMLACKKAYVSNCQGMKCAPKGHRANPLTAGSPAPISSRNPVTVTNIMVQIVDKGLRTAYLLCTQPSHD